ncbi:MAG: cytochrome c biogenesis protein CcsA [Deltaproteobacteria bacterium]|nr:cytochrome c biogenesis protein CcsA [Deltaproteobacteria bacterium]
MTWAYFNWLGPLAATAWLLGGFFAWRQKTGRADLFMSAGLVVFAVFMAGLWIGLERPPMRTMGETRLWYAFFLAAAGWLAYRRWKYPWLLPYSALMAAVFVGINLLKPEIHSKALMPALQSVFFIPHVTLYMLAYSVLAVAAIASVIQLGKLKRGPREPRLYIFLDNVVYLGLGLLMLGLISGAVWAKEAWGHYWSWDPKETWALITAVAYLLYIHLRLRETEETRVTLAVLPLAFILLLVTWLGVSMLPSASGSIHVYS